MVSSLKKVALARLLRAKQGAMAAVARQCPHLGSDGKEGAPKR
jgi:hypothetical protein